MSVRRPLEGGWVSRLDGRLVRNACVENRDNGQHLTSRWAAISHVMSCIRTCIMSLINNDSLFAVDTGSHEEGEGEESASEEEETNPFFSSLQNLVRSTLLFSLSKV